MRGSLNTQKIFDDRIWTCDDCGESFPNDEGCVTAGFGYCDSCIGHDWKKQMNIPAKEETIDMEKREEFSDLDHKSNLKSIRLEELIDLKDKYDKDFVKYWSAGGKDFPKFQPVSMENFVERLGNIDFFKKYGCVKIDL